LEVSKVEHFIGKKEANLGEGGLKYTFCGEAMDIFLKEHNFKCVSLVLLEIS